MRIIHVKMVFISKMFKMLMKVFYLKFSKFFDHVAIFLTVGLLAGSIFLGFLEESTIDFRDQRVFSDNHQANIAQKRRNVKLTMQDQTV